MLAKEYAAVEEVCERCIDCERCTFACEHLRASKISLNGIACCMRAAHNAEEPALRERILQDEVIKSAVAACTLCGLCVEECPRDVDVAALMQAARCAYGEARVAL